MFANSSGEGLDGSMEAVVRRLKHSITSFTLSAIENADWMASMSSNVTATLKASLGIKERLNYERPSTDFDLDCK